MNHHVLIGFICSFLLVSLAGLCIADESPGYIVYVQGGESSITNGSGGTYMVTVKDIVPYFYLTNEVTNSLIPVGRLANLTSPVNAALVCSGEDNETTAIVQVINASLSDDKNILTLGIRPQQYYDGERLKAYIDRSLGLETLVGSPLSRVGIILESELVASANEEVCTCFCPDGSCDPYYTGWLCQAGCHR